MKSASHTISPTPSLLNLSYTSPHAQPDDARYVHDTGRQMKEVHFDQFVKSFKETLNDLNKQVGRVMFHFLLFLTDQVWLILTATPLLASLFSGFMSLPYVSLLPS